MHDGNTEIVYTVIVAAAGSGKRMNLETKKQFLEYKGKPLYMECVLTAQNTDTVDEIVIVTSREDIAQVKEQCEKFGVTKLKHIVPGGQERQDSIRNALEVCKDGIIAVQDGARPFMKAEYLELGFKELMTNSNIVGAVVGVNVKDTIKYVQDGIVVSTPDRASLFAAQTPQIFRSEALVAAYDLAYRDDFVGTDDSSLVERIGGEIVALNGSYDNIKITTIEDLKYISQK